MVTITTSANGGPASVRFGYDEALVEIMRGVPDRKWDATHKRWLVPDYCVVGLAEQFAVEGESVVIDGELYERYVHAGASSDGPFGPLFDALPASLVQPVYRALIKVLHPDVGGDSELMKELNRVVRSPA